MKTQIFLFAIISFFVINLLGAQNNKIEGPLNNFVNTSFMLKFKDVKIEAEAAVRQFKLQSHTINPEDVQAVQTGYEQSAYRFNQLLFSIKGDFLNSKKVKYISEFPDDYLRSLELELHQLTEFYTIHFLQPLADANEEQVDGSAAILLIVELVGLTKGLVNYFSQVKRHSRQFSENYLQQHLIKPFHFRTWDEISTEGTMMPSPVEAVYTPEPIQTPSLDPLLDEASNLLTPNPTYNTNDYQSADTYDDYLNQNGSNEWEEGNPPALIGSDSTQLLVIPPTPVKPLRTKPKSKNKN